MKAELLLSVLKTAILTIKLSQLIQNMNLYKNHSLQTLLLFVAQKRIKIKCVQINVQFALLYTFSTFWNAIFLQLFFRTHREPIVQQMLLLKQSNCAKMRINCAKMKRKTLLLFAKKSQNFFSKYAEFYAFEKIRLRTKKTLTLLEHRLRISKSW